MNPYHDEKGRFTSGPGQITDRTAGVTYDYRAQPHVTFSDPMVQRVNENAGRFKNRADRESAKNSLYNLREVQHHEKNGVSDATLKATKAMYEARVRQLHDEYALSSPKVMKSVAHRISPVKINGR